VLSIFESEGAIYYLLFSIFYFDGAVLDARFFKIENRK